MRILMWVRDAESEVGGIERLVGQLSAALRKRGHQIGFVADLLGHEAKARSDIDGMPVWRFGMTDALQRNDISEIFEIVSRIRTTIREFGADIIHFHPSGPEGFLFLRVQSALDVPVVTTVHMDLERVLISGRHSALSAAFKASNRVVAISEFAMKQIHRMIPGLTTVHAIINAIESQNEPYRESSGSRILSLGRVVSDKGFDTLVAAMPAILDGAPEASLVIGGDGPERAALEEQAKSLGIANRIEFRGWIAPQDVCSEMRKAAVVAVPSRWQEPFGLVGLEGAWSGRPVVATRRGGLPEIVADGQTGLLVSHNDPKALSGAILSLLNNPDTARRMGQAALARAQSLFSFDNFVDSHEKVYFELANLSG